MCGSGSSGGASGGSSSGGGGGEIATSNAIKEEFLEKGLNSRLAGVRKRAEEGTGNYSFKNSTAITSKQAEKMHVSKIIERDGKVLIDGTLNNKSVFYANSSEDKTIKAIRKNNEVKKAKLTEAKIPDRINTTTTYDRFIKNQHRKFDDYYFGTAEKKKKKRGS